VLDIFKNNARLEIMYQSTAHQAFRFCSKYARKTEFRRLCELLRNHLQNAAKFSAQMHAINLSDPETLQRHLDTRFQQLNVAVELELWQEAFRSVEDIHTLLNLSKRPPKPIMMANYFENLTQIFLVSGNYLFHAAAWSRYFNLMRTSAASVAAGTSPKKDNPAVSEADMTRAASFVLLSALSIPVISTSRSRGALVDVDEARKNKNARLTNLLGMAQAPTRSILFKDALSKGLLRRCRPEIRELYNILEVDFHPLSICKRISPILTQIGSDPELEKYIQPLQQVILTRLFQQLSQVYESVELKFVLDLARFPDPFQISSGQIEKFIMNGCKKGDLSIRINHASGVLTFDSDVFSSAKALHPGSGAGSAEGEARTVQRLQSTPAEIVRSQLTRLAKALFITCQYVDPTFNEERVRAKEQALLRSKEGAEEEHKQTLARREVIERKKLAASTALAQKEKDIATQKRIRAQELQAAEAQRLAEEQKERDRRRLEAEKARVQQEEAQKALEELKRGTKGIDLDQIDVSGLDSAGIRAIKLKALEKEKTDLNEKLRHTARRVDHLERAYRREEVKHIPADYDRQRQLDLKAYEKAKTETLKEAEQKHKDDVALKHRLSRLVPVYESFKGTVTQQRKSEFEKRKKKAQQELQSKMDQRRKEHRERKAREKREREEEERRQREEEERIEREREEKARADEEKRARMAEEKAKRDEERR
jgi:translation initiation factor 3 subunit A